MFYIQKYAKIILVIYYYNPMVRRKYYNKNYYRKRRYSKKQNLDPIAFLIVISLLWIIWIYQEFIKPNINIILPIFFILLISWISLFIYLKYEKIKKEKARIANIPNFLKNLENKIKEFKPIRQYKEEKSYQLELVWFLKNNYPSLKIEEQKDYSRPDIIIDDIAIEIKWPTNMWGLKTLPDKINSYLPKWKYLFIVLFNISIVDDKEKNLELYKNKKKEILENTIESKRDKVFFIEI